jgi:hypothetical protein
LGAAVSSVVMRPGSANHRPCVMPVEVLARRDSQRFAYAMRGDDSYAHFVRTPDEDRFCGHGMSRA